MRTFAYYAFFPLMAAFLAYVGFGYYLMIFSYWPTWPTVVVIAVTLLILAAIYGSARHTGIQIHKTRNETGWRHYRWLPSFLFLFLLSGYGFLNSSMLLFEGRDIARDEISALSQNFGAMRAAAESLTENKDFDDFRGKLKDYEAHLLDEIANPGAHGLYCGIGPQAAISIGNIRTLAEKNGLSFPDASYFNKPLDCQKQQSLIEGYVGHYKEMVDKLLDGRRQQLGLDTRQRDKEQILDQISGDEKRLSTTNERLAQTNYIFDVSLYYSVREALNDASDHYRNIAGNLSQKLQTFSAAPIESGLFEQLGSGLHLPALIWARITRLPSLAQTIVLCLLAFACDASAAILIAFVYGRELELQRREKEANEVLRVGGKDVVYLWRPEPHPLATIKGGPQ
jgi:hypothetical protein